MFSRRFWLAALFAFVALPVAAQSIPADISGTYRADGRNPDGSAYSGGVTIQQGAGGSVAFAWVVGSQTYTGTGLREGRVVTVHWGAAYPVIYVIMPGGLLYGTWEDGRAMERLSR